MEVCRPRIWKILLKIGASPRLTPCPTRWVCCSWEFGSAAGEGHTFNFIVLRAEHHRFTYENSRTGENQEVFTYFYFYFFFDLLQHSTFMWLAEPQAGLWHGIPAWHLFTSPWHPRPNVSDTPGTRDPEDHPDRNGWSPSTSAWNRPRWGVLENIHAAFPALWKFRSQLGFHVL